MFSKVDVEIKPTTPDHARLDVGGIVNHVADHEPFAELPSGAIPGVGLTGGLVELRYCRRRSIQVIVWTQLAHDLGLVISSAIWRRIERRG